jgi:hypothetical protein
MASSGSGAGNRQRALKSTMSIDGAGRLHFINLNAAHHLPLFALTGSA